MSNSRSKVVCLTCREKRIIPTRWLVYGRWFGPCDTCSEQTLQQEAK